MIYADGKELYYDFLLSDFWIELSRLKRKLVSKCERCGSDNRLQAHHLRYPDNWFDTKLSDLKVLCRECHEKEHGISHVKDVDLAIDDTQIPEHAFIKEDPWAFITCRKDVERLRSRLKIDRKTYEMLRERFPKMQKLRPMFRRSKRKKKQQFRPFTKARGLNFHTRPNWVNRGTSSN